MTNIFKIYTIKVPIFTLFFQALKINFLRQTQKGLITVQNIVIKAAVFKVLILPNYLQEEVIISLELRNLFPKSVIFFILASDLRVKKPLFCTQDSILQTQVPPVPSSMTTQNLSHI